MGRGKIEIKRIENSSNRQVTYSKRRNGIIKKAKEIAVLCDSQVSVIIFSTSGKMHEFCSPAITLSDILEQYHKLSGKRLWDAKHEHLDNEINRIKKENDNMQIELRHLKGEDITTLNYKELMVLEEALTNGTSALKTKQRHLHLDPMDNGGNHVMESHGQGMYDTQAGVANYQACHSQMPPPPFAFRLQPMQPNLQDHF
ncbi:floral homeotic protein PMADS 2 [Dorcoceras hygrometricum]|uniref:Floral homeotic protein PMADS 2 n=1 Tax=Dorcoceras hygrometricum TaxID=472368 RepID=A0A2Z7B470_9LAMI|nr:floral homeotic protein PMADS 2 [Dorcoceras hygrometricum]